MTMANEAAAKLAENLQGEMRSLKKFWWLLLLAVIIIVFGIIFGIPFFRRGNPEGALLMFIIPLCGGIFGTLAGFIKRLARLTLAQQREIEELKSRLTALETQTV